MTRILLVETNVVAAATLELALRQQNFIVDGTDLGEDALQIAKLYDYDIIILDPLLPDIDGYEVLRELRRARVHTPVLILSARIDLDYKLKGLRFGADEFMTKPFEPRELIARIQAIVRRSKGHFQSAISTGRLTVDIGSHIVAVDDRPVRLTPKEYAMIELLSLRKGTALTKETFLSHLYGGVEEPDMKIIDVFICKLRKKLAEAAGGGSFIETVWGRGYIMRDPEDAGVELAATPNRPAELRAARQTVRLLVGAEAGRKVPGSPMPGDRRPDGPRMPAIGWAAGPRPRAVRTAPRHARAA